MTRELINSAQDGSFVSACEKANVKPTGAQYSKFRRKFGIAYNTMHGHTVGSHVFEETGLAQSDQHASGVVQPQEYGPYSSTPNVWPRPKKRA